MHVRVRAATQRHHHFVKFQCISTTSHLCRSLWRSSRPTGSLKGQKRTLPELLWNRPRLLSCYETVSWGVMKPPADAWWNRLLRCDETVCGGVLVSPKNACFSTNVRMSNWFQNPEFQICCWKHVWVETWLDSHATLILKTTSWAWNTKPQYQKNTTSLWFCADRMIKNLDRHAETSNRQHKDGVPFGEELLLGNANWRESRALQRERGVSVVQQIPEGPAWRWGCVRVCWYQTQTKSSL